MDKEIQVWNKVLSAAMSMPGVKVNRMQYLRDQFATYRIDNDKIETAIEQGTIGNIPMEVLDKMAKSCIGYHTRMATSVSTALGMPGGVAMIGTIPGDIAQFYFHVFVVSQKVAYIYGYPDLCDEKGNFSDSAADMLTVFVGVMSGVAAANKVIQELSEQFGKMVMKRLPQYALTQGVIYPLVRQVAKWIGVSLTKQSFSRGIAKFVPIFGGLVSGLLTYFTFRHQSKKLMVRIKESMQLAYNAQHVVTAPDPTLNIDPIDIVIDAEEVVDGKPE
jgi:hypothetical protein